MSTHKKLRGTSALTAVAMVGATLITIAGTSAHAQSDSGGAAACGGDNGGLTLSPGFCATVFADKLGHARHLVVAPNGVMYVNTWSGRYYHNDTPPPGGFLIALQDSKGSGQADRTVRFGPTQADGDAGGTGIAIYKNYVYAETNDKIVRYVLPASGIAPTSQPETVISGLPLTGDHPMHPFQIDAKGDLYVDLGSATNSCQSQNRMPNVPGNKPCTELETRGGTWRYDANRLGQHFSAAERFSTGLRNGEGISFDSGGRIFATQHGRDQLAENFASLYKPEQGANEPAEELVQLTQGADFGWPECYYDYDQKKLVLAPEYGGDGGKTIGVCAQKRAPVAAFPAHWAPNDMLIYEGSQFPSAYKDGAFIAFHGSWNRAPSPQGGYNVVFQPMEDGKASKPFVVFADGFAGAIKGTRPSGSSSDRVGGGARRRAVYRGRFRRPDLASYLPRQQSLRHCRRRTHTVWRTGHRVQYRSPARGNSSRRRGWSAADPARGFAGSGCAGRQDFPRSGGRRHLCRLPQRRWRRHGRRLRPGKRPLDMERRQRPGDNADDSQRRAATQGTHRCDATEGWRSTVTGRRCGRRRLCLGDRTSQCALTSRA